MNKSLILLHFCFLSIMSGFAQDKTILTGRINGLVDGSKVWLIGDQKDSAIVKNGVFKFYSHGLERGLYSLRLCRKYSSVQWKDIYIDNSPLKVKARDTLFTSFIISGAFWTKDFTDYEHLLEVNHINKRRRQVDSMVAESELNENKELYEKAKAENFQLNSDILRLQLNWVNKHRSSLVSSFILQSSSRYIIKNIEQLDSVLAQLSAKDNIFYKAIAEDIEVKKATGIGKPAPLFTQNDVDGKPFALKSLRGFYVLIDFWASWCVPCRAENPNLIATYKKFSDKGFAIIGVSLDEKKDLWIQAVKNDALMWTQVSDLKGWNNSVSKKYYITSVPMNFLISPEGVIIAKNLRGDELDKTLKKLLNL